MDPGIQPLDLAKDAKAYTSYIPYRYRYTCHVCISLYISVWHSYSLVM